MQKSRNAKRVKNRRSCWCMTLILTLMICLIGTCARDGQFVSAGESSTSDDTTEDLITDLYVDQARYTPGESAVLTVELEASETKELELKVEVTHLTRVVYAASETVYLTAGEAQEVSMTLELPEEDYTAYAVEVYLMQEDEILDQDMTAAEVASDWSKYPRYAYLTKYGNQSDEEILATLERLNKYHITGLLYYDVLDQHDKPLAGTVDSPDSGWYTLANHYASLYTVQHLIDYGHEYNMNSYLYNLIFAAYEGYDERGIDSAWGLFQKADGTSQDAHETSVEGWETQWLLLFNPANTGWQNYYLQVTSDVLAVFDYDGIQADSLGDRGTVYDYDGNEVNLAEANVSLLNRLASELETRVIFNPVGGYGMTETLKGVDYDIVYEEIWPYQCSTYSDLKEEIDSIRDQMPDEKGMVLAAYMNYGKSSGEFNDAGVLLTDAVLMASGASHMELGDTGMLNNEYYPGDTLSISDTLEAALRNYYSFDVAYENYLRDASYSEIDTSTYINGEAAASTSSADSIWCFTKENEDKDQVINFINLTGVSSTEWVDYDGTQSTPEVQTNLKVRQYVSAIPDAVYLASPDDNEGIMSELDFESGEDGNGTYITFTMPQLSYWNMVVIKMSSESYIYQAEDYYDGTIVEEVAADMQPGESITISLSDNGDFVSGTYALSVYSCGNRESFEVSVNGENVGTLSRAGTNFGQDQMTLDTLMVLELNTTDTVTITDPTTAGESGAYYGWVDYLVLEPVSYNAADDYITFRGGSLRMDYATDYSKTCLRFGYTVKTPDDLSAKSWFWSWGYDGSIKGTVQGVNYTANEDGTKRSNLVITGIPLDYFSTELYSQITVIYTRSDGSTLTVAELVPQTRSVEEVATSITKSSSATEDEVTYANGILKAIEEEGLWTDFY